MSFVAISSEQAIQRLKANSKRKKHAKSNRTTVTTKPPKSKLYITTEDESSDDEPLAKIKASYKVKDSNVGKRYHEPVNKETKHLISEYNSGVESNDDDEDNNSDSESEGTRFDEYNSSCESSDEDNNVKLSSIFTDSESDFDQPLPPLLSWLESQKRKPPKRNHLLPVPLLCTLIPLQVLSCINIKSPDRRDLQRRFYKFLYRLS